jgi:predicted RNase H-like nuclease (RuvC/YqgF family)
VKNLLKQYYEDTNLNLISFYPKKIVDDIIYSMSSKKKRVQTQVRPIDAIREMIEDLNLQISDLTQIVKEQKSEIRELKVKWNARESLEREQREKLEREADKSWFWASRTSE